MKNGLWQIADAIKFDLNGMLCDGQHRLSAVILAKISIDFLVIVGFSPDAAVVIDKGRNRTFVDSAKLRGESWITRDFSSTFNAMFLAFTSSFLMKKASEAYRIECMNELKEGILFANSVSIPKGSTKCAVVRGCIARAYYADQKINPGLLKNFMLYLNGYNSIEHIQLFAQEYLNYAPTMPLALRDFYQARQWRHYAAVEEIGEYQTKFYATQNALRNYVENKKVSKLMIVDKNLFPSKLIDSMFNRLT